MKKRGGKKEEKEIIFASGYVMRGNHRLKRIDREH